MERDSMIIYRSFFEAIKELQKTNQAEVWNAVYELGLNGKYVELNGISKTIFTLIAPQIEANYKKFINGSKPKTKQTESKSEAKDKQTRSKTEGNVNVNDNVNVIPSIEEFIDYAVSNVSDINTEEVRLKYQSWKVNNWCTNVKGKEKPIKNWKSTLLNTLPFLGRVKPEELSLEQLQYNYVQKMLNFKDTKDYSNAD